VTALIRWKLHSSPERYPLLHELPGYESFRDDPHFLLRVASSKAPPEHANPQDIPPWDRLACGLKNEALARLLELQSKHFSSTAPRAEVVSWIDHAVCYVEAEVTNGVKIVATPTHRLAKEENTPGSYYGLEVFEFASDGRLVRRFPFVAK